jgi:hypothetical protein
MEIEEAVVRNVVSKCLLKDLEVLIRKWGCFSEKEIKQIDFTAVKKVIASQIFQLCKVSTLISTQLNCTTTDRRLKDAIIA